MAMVIQSIDCVLSVPAIIKRQLYTVIRRFPTFYMGIVSLMLLVSGSFPLVCHPSYGKTLCVVFNGEPYVYYVSIPRSWTRHSRMQKWRNCAIAKGWKQKGRNLFFMTVPHYPVNIESTSIL
jgi:hypothetical protein